RRAGLALSGAVPDRAARLAQVALGHDRDRPARALLHLDPRRAAPARARGGELGPAGPGPRARGAGDTIRRLRDRARALLGRERVLADIDEELRSHIELEIEARVRRGEDPDEARRAALARFGTPAAIRDAAYDVRGGGMLESVLMDLRFALRL